MQTAETAYPKVFSVGLEPLYVGVPMPPFERTDAPAVKTTGSQAEDLAVRQEIWATRRYSLGDMPTFDEKNRVKLACDEKPRS